MGDEYLYVLAYLVVSDFLWPHGLQDARLPCPSPTPRAWSNMPIKSVMSPNHLILCHPCLLLPSIFPSIRVFSNEPVLGIRWPNYWSFSFSISLSNEYSGLTSFKIDWFDLCAVQGTLKSLLYYHSSKASIVEEAISFFFLFSIYLFVCSRHIGPSSLTRDWIWSPALGAWSLRPWATWEIPGGHFLKSACGGLSYTPLGHFGGLCWTFQCNIFLHTHPSECKDYKPQLLVFPFC